MQNLARPIAATLSLLVSFAASPWAAAQGSAVGEALFRKGVAQMEAGNYEVACPALAESQRIDPYPGTMFALAECEAAWGRIASSVAHYADYLGLVSHLPELDQQRHADRVKIAEAQLEKLRPQVPHLSLVLPPDAPKGTLVEQDGLALGGPSLGTALPVDPGEHVIVTQVPGGPRHEQRIMIEVGANEQLVVQLIAPQPVVPTQPPPTSKPPPSAPSNRPDSSADAGADATTTWAYAAGGIGLVGMATGSVLGLMAMGEKKTVDQNCTGNVCNRDGLDAADNGKLMGNISTIGFGVGIVGLATGTVLLLSSPAKAEAEQHSLRPTLVASPGGAMAGLGGAW